MEFSHQSISLTLIDEQDASFRVSSQKPVEALADNIQRFGIINPPILLSRHQRYVIISGFARVAAVRRLARETISVRILPDDTPCMTCVQLAIVENNSQRELNIIEQARAVHLLSNAVVEPNQLISAARDAGMTINRKLAAKLVQVYQMSAKLQEGIVSGAIALPVALRLHEMAAGDDAAALTQLLLELNLSLNRQREIMDWLQVIAHRDHKPIAHLLNEEPLVHIRNHAQLDRRQKSDQIRQYIKRCRYPEIVRTQLRYEALAKQLSLPSDVQLIPPPHFEGNRYSLRMNFTTTDELHRLQRTISGLTDSPVLARLLDPFD